MSLNRSDPAHVALIELAFAASQLVDDLHDYQHYLGGTGDSVFGFGVIEQHYREVEVAWERLRRVTHDGQAPELPAGGAVQHGRNERET